MNIFLMVILLIIGFILIVKGGDLFVSSASNIARIFRISEMVIGVTIVSVGTTMPELLTSTIATIRGVSLGDGYFDLAIGNSVGTMLANSGLILAIVLLVHPPKYDRSTFNITSIYVLVISILLTIFLYTDSILSTLEGVALLVLFIIFILMQYHAIKMRDTRLVEDGIYRVDTIDKGETARARSRVGLSVLTFIIGAISVSVGAWLLVDNGKALAVSAGVSEQLVGVTVVAIGTSLPELVTSMTALRKGSADISVGNILGAHVINATLILGLIATIHAIPIDDVTRDVAIWVLLAIMSILILPTLVLRRFTRLQGALMLISYLAYLCYNVSQSL